MFPSDSAPRPGTVDWWLRRLGARLDDRTADLKKWGDYYAGRLNLALASEKWRAEFAARFPAYSANFMAMVVDKHRERLQVQGIRYDPTGAADQEAWAWWQDNHLDSESLKLHREVLIKGEAHALVWPNADGIPEVSIETPDQTVVEVVPGKTWIRRAALKRWIGDDYRAYAELYLPDGIYKFASSQTSQEFSLARGFLKVADWKRLDVEGETWPIANPWGVVPVVPFVNRPDLRNVGASDIAPVASNQDAINKYRVDAFVASEFASFRQRWAIGLDIPVDPETGDAVEPFAAAVDRLWVVPPPDPEAYPDANMAPKTQFGEFDVTPLAPFYEAIKGEIQMLGTISGIPFQALLPSTGQPASGEAMDAAESGLTAKVIDSQVNLGESHEELFRLNFLMRGDPRGQARGAEVLWRDPAKKSEAQLVDALVKLATSLGIPKEALWERIPGVTPQTITRWKVMAVQEALENPEPAPAPVIQPPATGA